MKTLTKIFILFLITSIIACSQDKAETLAKLKQKRADIDAKIKQLEQEIGTASKTNKKEKAVTIKKIAEKEFNHFIEIQGVITSDKNIFVPPQAPGVVTKIHVSEGDKVTKGQLLAELDGAIIKKSLEQIKVSLKLAKTTYERQDRLWKQKIGSEIQYLQAKTRKETIEKQLETVEEQLRLTKIISPINGTIDLIKIKEGEAAAAGYGAIRVVQLSELKINGKLSEKYIRQIKKGNRVEVSIPSIDKTFEQKIKTVSDVIDPVNRTFTIEIKVPNSIKEVRPNMVAVLKINDYKNEKALSIPLNVIQRDNDKKYVFIAVKENEKWKARRKEIETGKDYNNEIEVEKGLNKDDKVITFGYNELTDGQEIKIKN